ncbi:MAG: YeeE/YedE family protein [Chloroflexi bacterium]|nr:YeeE/YedE family protein [Chloroflexota bacterium]
MSQPLLGFAALALAGLLLALFAQQQAAASVYWLIGLGFGFILQRSRLCFAGAFRDLLLSRDGRLMRAILLGLLIATAGFSLFMARLVPDPSIGGLPPAAHVLPVGLHLVVGGLAFGIGMVLAGGCVSGTLFRVGEGYVGSMVALLGILAGLEVAAHTWNWWWQVHIGQAPLLWLPQLLGHGGAVALTFGALAAAYLLVLWVESGAPPALAFKRQAAPPAVGFRDRLQALEHRIFVRGWPAGVGGAALGVLNLGSYVYDHPLGVTGQLSSWSDRLAGLLGLSAPPLLGVDRFAGCNLALGDGGWLNATFTLEVGLVAGAFIAALLASEFKLRVPRQRLRYAQFLGGGVLMGYGAGIGIGCTIGAFFSALPSLALSAWVFAPSLLAGAFLGVQVIKRLP